MLCLVLLPRLKKKKELKATYLQASSIIVDMKGYEKPPRMRLKKTDKKYTIFFKFCFKLSRQKIQRDKQK